jgi:hypothetical protein
MRNLQLLPKIGFTYTVRGRRQPCLRYWAMCSFIHSFARWYSWGNLHTWITCHSVLVYGNPDYGIFTLEKYARFVTRWWGVGSVLKEPLTCTRGHPQCSLSVCFFTPAPIWTSEQRNLHGWLNREKSYEIHVRYEKRCWLWRVLYYWMWRRVVW